MWEYEKHIHGRGRGPNQENENEANINQEQDLKKNPSPFNINIKLITTTVEQVMAQRQRNQPHSKIFLDHNQVTKEMKRLRKKVQCLHEAQEGPSAPPTQAVPFLTEVLAAEMPQLHIPKHSGIKWKRRS